MQMITFLLSFCFLQSVVGHGYLADPPSRSSAWLFDTDFYKCCRYFDHTQMSCGGLYRQWFVNGGQCSICGESVDDKKKLFDMGGSKYLGKIVRTYQQGAVIPVTVVLTANHLGNFEFRVCSLDTNPNQDATQACLNLNQLTINTALMQLPIIMSFTTVLLNVTLPANLTCNHCVFQWKYRTGNSWGSFNGKSGLGLGRENEEFYGCSDIAIVKKNSTERDPKLISPPMTTSVSGVPVVQRRCVPAVTFSQSFDIGSVMEQYCQTVCSTDCASDNLTGNTALYQSCQQTCAKLCTCQ